MGRDEWENRTGADGGTGHSETTLSPRRRFLQGLVATGVVGTGIESAGRATAMGGKERWRFQTDGKVWGSPTVVNGTVFVESADENLYAVDASDGTEQWRFPTNPGVSSSATVVDGTVFIMGGGAFLYAIDAQDGTEKWRFETGEDSQQSPTVVNKTVFTVSEGGTIYAVDASDGTQKWRLETDQWVESSPTVVDGTVFVEGADHLYAVNASDATEQWRFSTEDGVTSSPTVVDGTVYVGNTDPDLDGNLHAVDAKDGTEQWRFETLSVIDPSPTVYDGTVYVGNSFALYAVNASDGTEQWRFRPVGRLSSSPTIVDDTVFVGCHDNNLYAVDGSDGTEQWRFQTGGRVAWSSPTVVDGTVYVGSEDQNLYAVAAGVTGSSEGSRVMLGTLGHHGDWRYADQDIFNESPTANVAIDPTEPSAGQSVTFDASDSSDPDGEIVTYEWSIDGTTDTGPTVTHEFDAAREYQIKLTVIDGEGASDTVTERITVKGATGINKQSGSGTTNGTAGGDDSGGTIPVLTRFRDSGRSIGLGVGGLAALSGGGYATNRHLTGAASNASQAGGSRLVNAADQPLLCRVRYRTAEDTHFDSEYRLDGNQREILESPPEATPLEVAVTVKDGPVERTVFRTEDAPVHQVDVVVSADGIRVE
jgi:outer membrane protein assembly factor BamB